MTVKNYDKHAYEIVTEEGVFAVDKDVLAKFDPSRHEHGVAACCCNDSDCDKCEGKHCGKACRENSENHECAFCHLAFDTNEKCHEEILADLKELKSELAA